MTGKIKNVNEQKGYGFILSEDGKEYFFHRSGLINRDDWDTLDRGVEIKFDPVKGDKGPRAENIVLL